jgi:hypothetical protein
MYYQPKVTATPQPAYTVGLEILYGVVMRDGSIRLFENIGNAYLYAHAPNRHALPTDRLIHFIDPISAVWLGLVDVETLGLSEQTLAVLKLTMEDVK